MLSADIFSLVFQITLSTMWKIFVEVALVLCVLEMCVKLSHNRMLDSISKHQIEPNELRVIQKN